MRTLLTGFGPFGSVADNPTTRLVEHFAHVGAPGHEFTTQVFPVSYRRCEEVARLLRDGRFGAALLLGVAQRETHIRLEQVARNRDSARLPDCDDEERLEAVIRSGAPETYRATLSLDALLVELESAGLPVRLSDDAGGYICNHAYYAALHALAEMGMTTRCLFIHLPADERTFANGTTGPFLPFERQVEAVRRVLEYLRRTA